MSPVSCYEYPLLRAEKKKNKTKGALLLNFDGTYYYKSSYQVFVKGTKIFVFFVPFPFY
jgi:hypothetical protein